MVLGREEHCEPGQTLGFILKWVLNMGEEGGRKGCSGSKTSRRQAK